MPLRHIYRSPPPYAWAIFLGGLGILGFVLEGIEQAGQMKHAVITLFICALQGLYVHFATRIAGDLIAKKLDFERGNIGFAVLALIIAALAYPFRQLLVGAVLVLAALLSASVILVYSKTATLELLKRAPTSGSQSLQVPED